jgi:hypothetical protein
MLKAWKEISEAVRSGTYVLVGFLEHSECTCVCSLSLETSQVYDCQIARFH